MESAFPRLYVPWMERLLGRAVPAEPRATCGDCAMCRTMEPQSPLDSYFRPNVKCCSFMPVIPNFLAGSILLDDSPEFSRGRQQFQQGAVRGAVTPLGIGVPPYYHWLYAFKTFGRSEILLCPYFRDERGGECSIWQYRNARCSTWFCKFERGRTGLEFWRAAEQLLTALENSLSLSLARQLDAKPELDAATDQAWGPWAGRVRDFYKECGRVAASLSWEEVLTAGGPAVASLAHATVAAFQKLGDVNVPSRLRVGEYRAEPLGDGRLRIWGYSMHDPVDLSASDAAALARLEENPGSEVLLAPDLKLRLFDMRVFVPD